MQDPAITPDLIAAHGLKPDEYQRILEIIGREPTFTELGIFSAMWNEHCSYKSSKKWLRTLPTTGPQVICGPGENAGVVDIGDDGRITHCGPAASAPQLPAGAPVRECSGILLPGLVNAHAHSPMTLFRGMGSDLPLLRWLREVIWPAEARLREQDIRDGMRLGCVEMLQSGITTTSEMYFSGEAIAEAALDVGTRVVLAAAVAASIASNISPICTAPSTASSTASRAGGWRTQGRRFSTESRSPASGLRS